MRARKWGQETYLDEWTGFYKQDKQRPISWTWRCMSLMQSKIRFNQCYY